MRIASGPGGRIVVVFRNDDPSGASDLSHERRVAEIFDIYGVPQTLGVIPFCAADSFHDPAGTRISPLERNAGMISFLGEYTERSGSEIALHGYTHRTNRLSRPSKREYFEFRGIGLEEQEELVRKGTDAIIRCIGMRPQTFIPPWNRLDASTLEACIRNGYKIVSAGPYTPVFEGLIAFGTDCDLLSLPNRLRDACSAENIVFLRICYHSRTIRTPEEFRSLEKAVQLASETRGCETLTISEAVRKYPDGVCCANNAAKYGVRQEEERGTERAAAKIYRRAFPFLPQAKCLENSISEAEKYYSHGNYEEAAKLNSTLDRFCRKLRIAGMGMIGAAALLGALTMSLVFIRLDASQRTWGYAGAAAAILLAGMANCWYATSPDTRREILHSILLALAAGGVGVGLGQYLYFWIVMGTR